MKRILVTGAAGFIGSTLAEHLLRETSAEVIGIDAMTDYYPASIKERNVAPAIEAGLRFHRGSLLDANISKLLDGVDTVFHLAGQPGVRPSWGNSFSHYLNENVAATQALLEVAATSSTLERFVYASSSSVYGNATNYPTAETYRTRPQSPYGVTKLAAEHLCSLYASNFGVPTVSLRYFTVYGPRQRPDMAFTRFIVRCLTGQSIRIFGDGSAIRDFTYVRDIVAANIAAATNYSSPGSVFNVAGGSSTELTHALATISALCDRPVKVEHENEVPGDVNRTGGDSTAIHNVLGWKPETRLEQGLAHQVEWAKAIAHDYAGIV